MLSPIAWLSREEIVALGWTLLHFCWQGTAVAVAFAVVDRITSDATSKVRYFVALAAFMVMPVIVMATFTEELRVATKASTTQTTSPATPMTAQAIESAAQILSSLHLGAKPKPTLHPLPLASSLEESTDWLTMRADRILPWVDAVWFLGVLFLALRSLGGWWHLGVVRRRALRMVPQEVERAFLRLCKQIQVGRQVVLRASDEVISPLAMGVWRATVILPVSAVLSMPREELEAVIAHELGHIRRWDYLWNLLQTAVESVLFFHPAVWWLGRTVRDRREVCCDEIAVRNCPDAAVYARALLRLEEQRTVKLRMAVALQGCGGSLLARVRKVLGEDMALESSMTSGTSVAAVGALIITLLLGPKISEAVAAPVATRMQPVVAHVMKAIPAAVVSQLDAAGTKLIGPAAKPPQVPVSPKPSAPEAPPAPRAFLSSEIAINAVTSSIGEIEVQESTGTGSSQATGTGSGQGIGISKGTAYLDGMRDAGYPLDLNNDLNSLVGLKSVGVTPEYAKAMGTAGLGKPTVHDLIALKSMGVTPDYVASLKQSGIAPKDFHEVVAEKSMGLTPQYAADMKKSFGDLSLHDLIAMKSMNITPEYAAEMKQKGFGNLSARELISMKSLGVTPEYAAEMKQKGFGDLNVHELITMKSMNVTPEYAAEMKQKGFGDLSVHDLVAMKSLGVTPEYAAEMKQNGFGDLNAHQLISLKAQGMTPEYAGWLKQKFPQATNDELRRAATFHLDDKFVADAKSHGFDTNNLDKLLKLKMSGLLDQ
jgi:beta-lactamase regulating signal transducer with metallopeptidase domain